MSGKLPAIQLYTGDWLKDPNLSMCSAATRGIWMDFLCRAHELGRSGQITGTAEQFARLCRCTAADFVAAADELSTTGTATVRKQNDLYTITNRRMRRDYEEREGARERKQNSRKRANVTNGHKNVTVGQNTASKADKRSSQNGHKNVTPYSSSSSSTSVLPTEEPVTSASAIYTEIFGRELSVFQQEQVGIVTDLPLWRKTLVDWKTNQYSERYLVGMLESYRENAVKPKMNGKGAGENPYVGVYVGKNWDIACLSESELKPKPKREYVPLETRMPEPDWFRRLKDEIAKRVNVESFTTWFAPICFVAQDGCEAVITAPDRVFESWILANYRDVLWEAMGAAGCEDVSLVFQFGEGSDAEKEESGEITENPATPESAIGLGTIAKKASGALVVAT